MKPVEKRIWVKYLLQEGLSIQRACRLMSLSRSSYYYEGCRSGDEAIAESLVALHKCYPVYGFWKLFHLLRQQGHQWNHKPVWRVYKALGLKLRLRKTKKLPKKPPQPLSRPSGPNESWSLDFMSDSLITGRKIRSLNVIDDFNREALAMEIDTCLTSQRVIQLLERLVFEQGKPQRIRTDNGPEFIAHAITEWCEKQNIQWVYIRPGKPQENAYVERFNGSARREFFNLHLFEDLNAIRRLAEKWRIEYNCIRPHKALKYMTPQQFKQKVA